MPAPYVRLGRITRTHGIDGEVVLAGRDDLPAQRLVGLQVWVVPPPTRGALPLRIGSARPGPKGMLLSFDEIRSRDEARDLTGSWILVRESELGDLDPQRQDVLGYTVVDEERGDIGEVSDTIVTGANDVLVVDGGPFGQVLVPVIDEVVIDVDDDRGRIAVRLLPGLIDEDPR
jgi:16S rRNA processing protein RimM